MKWLYELINAWIKWHMFRVGEDEESQSQSQCK